MSDDPEDKFLIEEYKTLWTYYTRTLDERHKLLEYYYKTVPLPAALITALLAIKVDENRLLVGTETTFMIGASALCVIFILGIVTYTTYIKESVNGRKYEIAAKAIRERFRSKYPDSRDHLIIGDLRGRPVAFGTITGWRGGIFVVLNAAAGVAAVAMMLRDSDCVTPLSVFLFALLIIAQWG